MSESEKVYEPLVLFPYKKLNDRVQMSTILVKDGQVIPPVRITKDYIYYREKDYNNADVILFVKEDITKKGVFHDCKVIVRNPKPESLDKMVEIHNCPQTLYYRSYYGVHHASWGKRD